MDAIKALHTRVSAPRLADPAPSREACENIFRAALRAADHGMLRPWRFLLVAGASRRRLGELFVEAALADDPALPDARRESLRGKPLRAPLIVVVVASARPHPKVPPIEQELSAACAAQNMLVAAHAQGVGAMWRTGAMAYHPAVRRGLGLEGHEKITGFLYLGSPDGPPRTPPEPDPAAFFRRW